MLSSGNATELKAKVIRKASRHRHSLTDGPDFRKVEFRSTHDDA